MLPPPTGFEPPKILPTYNQEFRTREETRLKQLGLPVQSAAPRATAQRVAAPAARPAVAHQQAPRTGAKTFDPDKNFKAFEHILQPGKKATHKDYDFSRYFTKKPGAPTSAPAPRRQTRPRQAATRRVAAPSTARPFFQAPTTVPSTQKPFVTRQPVQAVTTTTRRPTQAPVRQAPIAQAPRVQSFNAFNQNSQFNRPAAKAILSSPAINRIAAPTKKVQTPARDLEPPLTEIKTHDDGTTKGPSAYVEWKTPERGLMPPRFDNDTDDGQSKRSVLEEGNFEGNNFHNNEARRVGSASSKRIQYKDLQKMFSIPQFEFPIESEGRDGYENAEAVNSFQVKIPYKTGKNERYYYLEHSHCNPECHPYFFKPGRCEPCIKL